MKRANRISKSLAARTRRKTVKDIIYERTKNFYSRLRKLRKKNKK